MKSKIIEKDGKKFIRVGDLTIDPNNKKTYNNKKKERLNQIALRTSFKNRKVRINQNEYTYTYRDRSRVLDCYAGDTGIIEYVDSNSGLEFSDLSFVIKLDKSVLNDGRERDSVYATSDYDSVTFL